MWIKETGCYCDLPVVSLGCLGYREMCHQHQQNNIISRIPAV